VFSDHTLADLGAPPPAGAADGRKRARSGDGDEEDGEEEEEEAGEAEEEYGEEGSGEEGAEEDEDEEVQSQPAAADASG
jgi:hypothetical protein